MANCKTISGEILLYKNGYAIINSTVLLSNNEELDFNLSFNNLDENLITKSSILRIKTTTNVDDNSLCLTYGNNVIDYGINNNGYIVFDLTKIFVNNKVINNFKVKNISGNNITIYAMQSNYPPVLEYQYYLNSVKFNDRKFYNISLSNDTNIAVDLLGGRLLYEKAIFSNVIDFNLSIKYQNNDAFYSFYNTFLPSRFKLNIFEYFVNNTTFINSDFELIEFALVNNTNNIYYDKSSLGLLYDSNLKKLYNTYDDSYKLFDNLGRITKIVDNLGNEINITYNTNNIIISSILCTIKIENNHIYLNNVSYYTFTNTTIVDLNNETDTFVFNNDNKITEISLNNEKIDITYNSDRVIEIIKYGDNDVLEDDKFTYTISHCLVTNRKNVGIHYIFNDNLELTNEFENSILYGSKYLSNDLSNLYHISSSRMDKRIINVIDENIPNIEPNTEINTNEIADYQLLAKHYYQFIMSFESENMIPNRYSGRIIMVTLFYDDSTQDVFYLGYLYGIKEIGSIIINPSSNCHITNVKIELFNQKGHFVFDEIYIRELDLSNGALYYLNNNGNFNIDNKTFKYGNNLVSNSVIFYSNNTPITGINLSMKDIIHNKRSYQLGKNIYYYNDLSNAIYDNYDIKYSGQIYNHDFVFGIRYNSNNLIRFEYFEYGSTNYQYDIEKYNNIEYKAKKEYNNKMLITKDTDIDNFSTNYTYDSNYRLTLKKNTYQKESYEYDNYNRLTRYSYYVYTVLVHKEFNYINNTVIISSYTDENSVVTSYTYSSNLKYMTNTSRGGISINNSYSQGKVTNTNINNVNNINYTYSDYDLLHKVNYANNDLYQISRNYNDSSAFDEDIITSLDNNKYKTVYDDYQRISFICEKHLILYLPMEIYIYSDFEPSDITSTNPTVSLSIGSKLYKAVDLYSNRKTYYNYNDKELLNNVTLTDNSNNNIILENISYDDLDRIITDSYVLYNTSLVQTYVYDRILNRLLNNQFHFSYVYASTTYTETLYVTNTYTFQNMLTTKTYRYNYFNFKYKYNYTYNGSIYPSLPNNIDFYHNYYSVPDSYVETSYMEYDNYGNVTRLLIKNKNTNQVKSDISYLYDNNNRLIRETDNTTNTPVIKNYTYDSHGNILSGDNDTYTYDNTYKDKLISFNNQTITYDSNLNITSLDGCSFSYNRINLLSSSSKNNITTSYTYDKDRFRITKSNSNENHQYYYLNGKLLKETIIKNSETIEMVFLYDNDEIIGFTYRDNTYIYKKNIFKDVVAIYLNGVTFFGSYKYDAYGRVTVYDNSGNIDTNLNSVRHMNPIRYRSYYYDKETNLYYLHNRYYSPVIRRFISLDDISYLEDNIDGLNLYAYCLNNPIMYTDEDGTIAIISVLLIGACIGAAVGVVGQAVTDTISNYLSYGFELSNWQYSSWQTYIGSAIGGAIGGALTPFMGPVMTSTISGAVSSAIGMTLENLTGKASYSFGEVLFTTLLSASVSGITAGIFDKVKISGINKGRGSLSAIQKQVNTKLMNNQISRVSAKTIGKMLSLELINSIPSNFINSFLNKVVLSPSK